MPRQAEAAELANLRGRNAKHFLNPDGTRTAEFAPLTHWWNGSGWADKVQSFHPGSQTAEWVSDSDEVTVRTYQVGQGGNRRWWVQFKDTLTQDGIEFELRFQPLTTAGSNRLDFSDGQGGTWSYYHTSQGGKMYGPPTTTAKGPQSFTFSYRLLGNAPTLTLEADGSVSCGSLFRMERAHLEGADGVNYPGSAWTMGAGTLSFSYNDTSLPASAYPYRVDPSTTFTPVSLEDRRIQQVHTAYPPTAGSPSGNNIETTTVIRNNFSSPNYTVAQYLFKVDTSSINDAATVTAATLRLFLTGPNNTNTRNLVGEYFTWTAAPSDWTATPGNGAFSAALSGVTASAYNDFSLSSVGSSINKTGTTYLRMGIDGSTPTGANEVTTNTADNASNKPQLVVDYEIDVTPPAAPSGLTIQVFRP